MDELRIAAGRYDFGSQFFKLVVLLRQSSEFRCSDESEVGGIEEQNSPFFCSFLGCETEFAKIALGRLKSFEFEIGNGLTNTYAAAVS